MRIGFLGPADGDSTRLERAADFLLNVQRVARAIYLGDDGALEHTVEQWARTLVGDDPTDAGTWRRAAELAAKGTPEQIDELVTAERMRFRLRVLESLPPRVLRTVEMIGDRLAVLIFDKALLDEEDIFAANLLIFGKNDAPLVKKIGARWFIAPGAIGPGGGTAVLDDDNEEIVVTLYDANGKATWSEQLTFPRTTKMRVQGL